MMATGQRSGRRDLRRTGVEASAWRDPVDGRAPRLGPGEYIGTGMARTGRFASRDPLRTGRVWSRWQWLAAGLWAALLGGSLAKARREHGER